MNNRTVFNHVITYIDENITKDPKEIISGLSEIIRMPVQKYNMYFQILTGNTLFAYIHERRIYWAAKELIFHPNKPIADIALSYGYSEQSALTRVITSRYGFPPKDIRDGKCEIEDNRPDYQELTNSGIKTSTMDHILEVLESGNGLSGYSAELIAKYSDAQHDYPFSPNAISTIFDLAEQLRIPVELLLDACLDVYITVQENPEEFFFDSDHAIAAAVDCGITTEKELKEICQYYGCLPIDLDPYLVEAYRSRDLSKSPFSDSEETFVDPS